jgi:hypothetical protein
MATSTEAIMLMRYLGRSLAFTLCVLGFFIPPQSSFARAGMGSLGIFEEHTDIGNVTPPGTLKYDPSTGVYTMTAAGANIWNLRDDFHFAWKKMSGDVSLTADTFRYGPASTKSTAKPH